MTTDLDQAIEGYLAYLRVERGLADATLRAYRADLSDFAMSRGAARDWAGGPEVAHRYLAARARRGRPNEPGLAPTSLRRRTASIRGFYRFAYGDGLIAVDVAAHLDLPRQPRLLPETLTVEEVERLLEAAGGAPAVRRGRRREPTDAEGVALRDRALLELLYAAGLRVSEALRPRPRASRPWTRRSCASSARATRNVSCPWATSPSRGWAATWPGRGPHGWRGQGRGTGPGRRCSSPSRGHRLGRQGAWTAVKNAADAAGPGRPGLAAHAPPLVRDAPPRGRRRPAHRPGDARACEYCDDPAVHARHRGTDQGDLRPRTPAGVREDTGTMGYADTLLASGERIVRIAHQHWFILIWRARWAVFGLLIAVAAHDPAAGQPRCQRPAVGHPGLGSGDPRGDRHRSASPGARSASGARST